MWHEARPDFGGFSGLALDGEAGRIFALTDRARIFERQVERDGAGRITAVAPGGPVYWLLDNGGHRARGFHGDSEALRLEKDGAVLVAFEGYGRVSRFRLPDVVPERLNEWNRFTTSWGNGGMEGLGLAQDGRLVAVVEYADEAGNYIYRDYKGGRIWDRGAGLASDGRYQAVDADFGPDGRLYVLERRISLLFGYQTRISAYPVATDGRFGAPEVALETRAGVWGNFEGMDVWQDSEGRLIATLISDNNFLFLSPTILAEFELAKVGLQAGQP